MNNFYIFSLCYERRAMVAGMFCMLRSCLNTDWQSNRLFCKTSERERERPVTVTHHHITPPVWCSLARHSLPSLRSSWQFVKYWQSHKTQLLNSTWLRRLINDFIIICVIASQEMRLQNFQICIYNKFLKWRPF